MTFSPSTPESEQEEPAHSFKAWQVWLYAITRPNLENYRNLHRDPDASKNRGYIFIVVGQAISVMFLIINAVVFGGYGGLAPDRITLQTLFCGAIGGFVLAIVLFAIVVAITNWVAQLLGGNGNYDGLVYLSAAWYTPYIIIHSLFSLVSSLMTQVIGDLGNCLTLPVTLGIFAYIAILQIIAVRTVHDLSWERSILSILPVLALAVGLFVVIFILLIALAAAL